MNIGKESIILEEFKYDSSIKIELDKS